jgi:CHASE1-domain containing sensor protein
MSDENLDLIYSQSADLSAYMLRVIDTKRTFKEWLMFIWYRHIKEWLLYMLGLVGCMILGLSFLTLAKYIVF